MTTQLELETKYPHSPGHKSPGTSAEAADATKPFTGYLRDRALEVLQREPLTADEVAERLGVSILSVRPRISELRATAKIIPDGKYRLNSSWRKAMVWRALP